MNDDNERRIAARLAKAMALMCVRNGTMLEDLHAGIVPVSRTGDFSDVVVTDANGQQIPWTEVSHFDNEAMRELMRQIVNRIYSFHLSIDDPRLHDEIERWYSVSDRWDDPDLDKGLMRTGTLNRDVDRNDSAL